MATTVDPPFVDEPVAPPGGEPDGAGEWQKDRQGREWVARNDGRPGRIIRRDGETIEQARARDSAPPEDRRPRRTPKTKTPPKPPPPRKADLKKLEAALAEALKAPGALSATFLGDEWLAQHFQVAGPYFARNLIMASEYNPWLRAKLEEAATGQDAFMKVAGLMGVAGALVLYTAPPVIYLLNLRVPDQTREMMGIPPRREPVPQPQPQWGPDDAAAEGEPQPDPFGYAAETA